MPKFEKKVKFLVKVPKEINDLILLYQSAEQEYLEMKSELSNLDDDDELENLENDISEYESSLSESDDMICESIDELLSMNSKKASNKIKKANKELSSLKDKKTFVPNKDYRFSTNSIKN